MDYLQLAKDGVDTMMSEIRQGQGFDKSELRLIEIYVAIAQAENTKRLADLLEEMTTDEEIAVQMVHVDGLNQRI